MNVSNVVGEIITNEGIIAGAQEEVLRCLENEKLIQSEMTFKTRTEALKEVLNSKDTKAMANRFTILAYQNNFTMEDVAAVMDFIALFHKDGLKFVTYLVDVGPFSRMALAARNTCLARNAGLVTN